MVEDDPRYLRPVYFPDFQHAYTSVLRQLTIAPQFRIATRGYVAAEILDVRYGISAPRQRVLLLDQRTVNLPFHLAEALWYLAGRNDVEMMAHYAPSFRRSSIDGQILTGMAYGSTMMRPASGGQGESQWSQLLNNLRTDPDTKRGVLGMYDPHSLPSASNPDVACTMYWQFLLRGGELRLSVSMRANDAFRGMPADVFSATFVQEFLATQLRVELGAYVHQAGSMHLNDTDVQQARRALPPSLDGQRSMDVPKMPQETTWVMLDEVFRWEEDLRFDRRAFTSRSASELPQYWRQVIAIFELYRLHRVNGHQYATSEALRDMLPPVYRHVMHQRFSAKSGKRSSL